MKQFMDHDIAGREVATTEQSFIEVYVKRRVTDCGVGLTQPLFFLFGCKVNGTDFFSILGRSKMPRKL